MKTYFLPLKNPPSWLVRVALLVALFFVVHQWRYSGGFPYIRDGNESALSFVHALNLRHFNPFETGFLTTYDTELTKPSANPALVYTHNPNFPRYVHYVLLLLGVDSFTTQVLIITFSVTILNLLSLHWLLRQLLGPGPFAPWIALVPLFATVFDYLGFLSFTVNTYRTFCFCLLWLSLLSVLKPWGFVRIFTVFFVLCQLEYGFALFVLTASLILWLLHSRPGGWRTLAAMAGGTFASLLLFFAQLVSFYSFAFVWRDFQSTADRRGGGNISAFLTQTLPDILSRLQAINLSLQNWLLAWALVSVLITFLFARRAPAAGEPGIHPARRALAKLFVALLAGLLAGLFAMTNYFTEAFFGSVLPLLTFFNVTASGIFVADIWALALRLPGIRRSAPLTALVVIAGGLSITPLLANSLRWWREYPGLRGDYVRILQQEYAGKPVLIAGHFNQVPTALTLGPTLQMNDTEPTIVGADFSRFERFRDANGDLIYLCLNLKWVGFDAVMTQLRYLGYEILQHGPDFAFVRIKGPEFLRTTAAVAAPDSAFGAVRLRLTLPAETGGLRTPLIACGSDGSGNLVYLQQLEHDLIRVGLDAGPRGAFVSPPFRVEPNREHLVEISHGSLYPPPGHPRRLPLERGPAGPALRFVRVLWDNESVLEAELALPQVDPAAVRIGEGPGFPDTAARFAGQILSVERAWPDSFVPYDRIGRASAAAFGPLVLEVQFPRGAAGRSEPLVTSGLTGAGNFLYVRYLDDRHVQFGFDHWGLKGVLGETIEIEPDRWYRLTLSMGSLYPPRDDPWFAEQTGVAAKAVKGRVTILMDDRLVLSTDSPAHESPAAFVRVGVNGIGGSTTGPDFTGTIRSSKRVSPATRSGP